MNSVVKLPGPPPVAWLPKELPDHTLGLQVGSIDKSHPVVTSPPEAVIWSPKRPKLCWLGFSSKVSETETEHWARADAVDSHMNKTITARAEIDHKSDAHRQKLIANGLARATRRSLVISLDSLCWWSRTEVDSGRVLSGCQGHLPLLSGGSDGRPLSCALLVPFNGSAAGVEEGGVTRRGSER